MALPLAAATGALTNAQTLPAIAKRPRLYYTAAQAAAIRARLAKDPDLRQHWSKLMESASQLLSANLIDEATAEHGGGQHANYGAPGGQIADMGLTLGLAWAVTGDKRHADKLKAALLHYSTYKRWGGQGLADRVPPWHSELNTARFCFGFATGYDAIRDTLTAAERRTVATAMVDLGIEPVNADWLDASKRIHALDSMGHNWWSVCVAMAGVATLSLLGDDERAPAWLDRIQRGFELWFGYRGNVLQNKPPNFDRVGGGFYEGLGYTAYGLSEYLRFRLAWANVLPNRPQPAFEPLGKLIQFFAETLYPTADGFYTPNVGDSSLHVSGAHTVRLLLETGFSHPSAGWYLKRVPEPSGDPFAILARKPVPAVAPPERLRTSILYPDLGWAIHRSSWRDDATMLVARAGATWNHVHADSGSFLLFHDGKPIITDSGAVSYSDPLYTGYYVQSRAHNVLLFNGQEQPREDIRRGAKFPGELHSLLACAGLKYAYADATGPMARHLSRNYRHWLWVDDVIIVFDEARSFEEGRFDWLLHHEGTVETSRQGLTLSNGNARCGFRMLYPESVKRGEQPGYADHRPQQQQPYIVFSTTSPAREARFVSAILPWAGNQPPSADLSLLSDKQAVGVRIQSGASRTDAWLNQQADGRRMHENSNAVIAGWETDAYLFAATEGPAPRTFVSEASYLRRSGQVLLDSLSKVDAIWTPGPDVEVAITGQDRLDVRLSVAERPRSLRVNGRTAVFTWHPSDKMIGIRTGR